ncbi:Uncharacterised protein [Raoultella planticola]|uniref:Uncharacterized protein n=1 Tax=Raoultella planticola TaxID=575 RepID=A0A485D648_RAOPL|nr:Uncharacterised protein [Raoultella planticola]
MPTIYKPQIGYRHLSRCCKRPSDGRIFSAVNIDTRGLLPLQAVSVFARQAKQRRYLFLSPLCQYLIHQPCPRYRDAFKHSFSLLAQGDFR